MLVLESMVFLGFGFSFSSRFLPCFLLGFFLGRGCLLFSSILKSTFPPRKHFLD